MKTLVVIVALTLSLSATNLLAGDARTAFFGNLAPVPAAAHYVTASLPVTATEPIHSQIALRLQPDGRSPEAGSEVIATFSTNDPKRLLTANREVGLMCAGRC